ncbi:MAG: hypothetical protein ACEPO8_00685 [Rhodothermaceae bacterium]
MIKSIKNLRSRLLREGEQHKVEICFQSENVAGAEKRAKSISIAPEKLREYKKRSTSLNLIKEFSFEEEWIPDKIRLYVTGKFRKIRRCL